MHNNHALLFILLFSFISIFTIQSFKNIDSNLKIGICLHNNMPLEPSEKCFSESDLLSLHNLRDVQIFELTDPMLEPSSNSLTVLPSLDLILTCNTHIAHHAANLGKPTIILVPQTGVCECLIDKDGTPLYSSLRILRASKEFSWQTIIDAVVGALQIAICKPKEKGHIYAEISVGELIDKITILEIKQEKIKDPAMMININKELTILVAIRDENIHPSHKLNILTNKLRTINLKRWETENAIRAKENKKEFDEEFIQLARTIYFSNAERHEIKHEISLQFDSTLIEENLFDNN